MSTWQLKTLIGAMLAGSCTLVAAATATVYYYTPYKSWTAVNMHHNGSGTWTVAPGVAMEPACTGWTSKTVEIGTLVSFQAVFNNGAGAWDNLSNVSGSNYVIPAGIHQVKNGQLLANAGTPCTVVTPIPPTAPVLSAGTPSANSVTLTWTASTDADGVKGYGLVRGSTVRVKKTGTTFTDTGLTPGATYKYYVVAEDNTGLRSAKSNVITVINGGDTTKPSTPTGLTKGIVGPNSVALSWTASTDASGIKGYGVLRNNVHVGSSTSTSYTDTKNLSPSTTYSYTIVAQDRAGLNSLPSTALSVTTAAADLVAPSTPLNLVASAPSAAVALTWTASTDNVGVTGYEIFRAPSGGSAVLLGTSPTASYNDTTSAALTAYTYTVKARDAAGNRSTAASVNITTGAVVVTPGYYKTNPNNQVGKAATITLDGAPTEWTADMIIAQGVANDDPRIFRGSHEGPVYDLYALYAAWDDSNLYLMWQFTNVTDVADPAQGYPISDNGKPYQGDIPQSIAFDVDPAKGGNGTIDGTTGGIWGMKHTFGNNNVDRIALFSSKPGVGVPAMFKLNANNAFDYTAANVLKFVDAGISFKYADGFKPTTLMGINDNGNSGNYTPADLSDTSRYVDFLTLTHSKTQDTTYEMKIPLTALGITRAQLESNGIGVMLLTTFGVSPIGSLPQDAATLDNAMEPYSADASSSKEKEDADVLTAPFARIGKK